MEISVMEHIRDLKVKLTEVFPTNLKIGEKTIFNGEIVKIIAYSPWHDGATIEYEDGRRTWVDCFQSYIPNVTDRFSNSNVINALDLLARQTSDTHEHIMGRKFEPDDFDNCIRLIQEMKWTLEDISDSLYYAKDRSDPCRCNR